MKCHYIFLSIAYRQLPVIVLFSVLSSIFVFLCVCGPILKMSANPKRKEVGEGGNKKKQANLYAFFPPSSPAASVSSPVSAAASVSSPSSPAASVSSPSSPAASVSSPSSPAASVSSAASPAVENDTTCYFCTPPQIFKTVKGCREHERRNHSEEKGLFAPPMPQDRSQTRPLFERYLPVLPEGFTTHETPLGIYVKNCDGQIIGAFHMVIGHRVLSPPVVEKARARLKNLFVGSSYSQGHIIPASSAMDDETMLELSYDAGNFEPLNPLANSNIGGKIEEHTQNLSNKYLWSVCVFVLLDKNKTLGTIKANNGQTYTISGNWSYLIFMERQNESFYEAFSFPNEAPTMKYWSYRTTIAAIRAISGLDFQFGMSESISQHFGRVKQEKYEKQNPLLCRYPHLGCNKRFPTKESRDKHEYYHANPDKREKRNEVKAKYHAAKKTSVKPPSTAQD